MIRQISFVFAVSAAFAFGSAPGQALASDEVPKAEFDWMANGADQKSSQTRLEQAKAAIIKARALSAGASWVCSPAGFGKRSHCERG